MAKWMSFCLWFGATTSNLGAAAASGSDDDDRVYRAGIPCTKPVHLGLNDFDQAIGDSANSVWLLKFYAPWCGHCKRMAPMLDSVAPKIAPSMAIGKIDCTTERKLCDVHKVKGYPTMKYSVDGKLHDYPGGRTEAEILQFAKKMSKPVITQVPSILVALEHASQKPKDENQVVFVAYHPDLKDEGDNNKDAVLAASKTPETQVFAQVARKFRVTSDFLLVVPPKQEEKEDEQLPETAAILKATPNYDQQPYVCRIEPLVQMRCVFDHSTLTTVNTLSEFIKSNQIPTVSALGPHNFQAITRNGRPTVIGVVANNAGVEEIKNVLLQAATFSNDDIDNKFDPNQYYFGWMDGGQYHKFLEQFGITKDALPQVFVFDAIERLYWQNSTHYTHLVDSFQFLKHVQNTNLIEARVAGKGSSKGMQKYLDLFYWYLVEYKPWSIILLVFVVMAMAVGLAILVSPGDLDDGASNRRNNPPPKKRKQEDSKEPSTAFPEQQQQQDENKEELKKDK
eukprot:CAMPEP_0198138982 /NCGR_PEP_ID=MMETSP1443-20131203/2322_1 /TAXON_ID=186043 /ORGANISM="Entomoneis sp., Strain CCMP2396" /LENGTH=508 /DNA_ID=CAMNT_0043800941 /DNA_START=16 /DNA_END=1542 /DNA_ORIENTATION=+